MADPPVTKSRLLMPPLEAFFKTAGDLGWKAGKLKSL
jgi:hypothetical protein